MYDEIIASMSIKRHIERDAHKKHEILCYDVKSWRLSIKFVDCLCLYVVIYLYQLAQYITIIANCCSGNDDFQYRNYRIRIGRAKALHCKRTLQTR